MNPLTYWGFHLIFTLPAFVAALMYYLRVTPDSAVRKQQLPYVPLLALIAFVYTTPWDNYLVKNEIWTYGLDRVSHVIGYVPIEEYAFFILQPLVTGLFYFAIRNKYASQSRHENSLRQRVAGAVVILAVTAVTLINRTEPFTYLRLIVGWSFPVVAAQWFLFGDYFLQRMRTWTIAVAVPTIFFSVADRIAIGSGVWDITLGTSTAVMIGGLPVEEFLFFLITNVLVVQGLMLFVPDPSSSRLLASPAKES